MMRKKALEDKKRKLDEQAAAMLSAKKARLQKETPPAPSESDIDMGVFSGDRGNLLEEIYAASAPTGKAFVIVSSQAKYRAGLIFRKSLLLLPPRLGQLICLLLVMIWVKRRERGDVNVEHKDEGGDVAGGDGTGGAGAGGADGDGKYKGVDT
ncbi:hypothetical protein HanPI659440_Chr15g0586981 [Helianthus annuus]|nr:hypothetical protein HanPI659440_Chr15g0586981 [Helianthus annuus]